MQISMELLKNYSWLMLLSFSAGCLFTYFVMRSLLNRAREKFFQLQDQSEKEEFEWQAKVEAEHGAFEKASRERDLYAQEKEDLQMKLDDLKRQTANLQGRPTQTPPPMQPGTPVVATAQPPPLQHNPLHAVETADANHVDVKAVDAMAVDAVAVNGTPVDASATEANALNENSAKQGSAATSPDVVTGVAASGKPKMTPDMILQQARQQDPPPPFDWARLDDTLMPIVERLREFEKMIGELRGKSDHIVDLKKDLHTLLSLSATNSLAKPVPGMYVSPDKGPSAAASPAGDAMQRYAYLGNHMSPLRWLERFGLVRGKDFFEKASSAAGHSSTPDFIVRLPDEKTIFIDCHTLSMSEFNSRLQATGEPQILFADVRKALEVRRDEILGTNADDELAACEMHFILIPSEMIYLDLIQAHPELVDQFSQGRVNIISPIHLGFICKFMGLLSQQMENQEDIEKVLKLGKDLGLRTLKVIEAVDAVGTGLHQTVNSFNDLMRSVDFHLISTVRKVEKFNSFDWPKFQRLNEDLLPSPSASRNSSLHGGGTNGGGTGGRQTG